MRVLLVARRSARQQRLQSLNQLRHLVFTSPEPIRVRFKDRYKTGLVTEAANMRLRKGSDPVAYTTNLVIRNLARRVKRLNNEMREIDPMLTALVEQTAPSLLALYGLGPDTAASLLVAVGEQPRPARFGGVLGPLVWCRPAPRQLMVDFEWGVASSIAAQAILGATPAITKGFIPPVIRTQRRRQNGGLSDPSPPSSSTGGLEGVCGGGGGGIEGLAVCGGYHFPSLACHQPSPCDASAPPFAMVDRACACTGLQELHVRILAEPTTPASVSRLRVYWPARTACTDLGGGVSAAAVGRSWWPGLGMSRRLRRADLWTAVHREVLFMDSSDLCLQMVVTNRTHAARAALGRPVRRCCACRRASTTRARARGVKANVLFFRLRAIAKSADVELDFVRPSISSVRSRSQLRSEHPKLLAREVVDFTRGARRA